MNCRRDRPDREWTEREDARLCAMRAQGLSFTAIGACLGRSKNSALGRATRLGLPQGPGGRAWTPERDAELRRRWAVGEPVDAIATAMRATRSTIHSRRYYLGLAPRRPDTVAARAARWRGPPGAEAPRPQYALPLVLGQPRGAEPLPALHPYTWALLTAHAPDLYAPSTAAVGSSLATAGRGGRPAALPLGGAPASAEGGL